MTCNLAVGRHPAFVWLILGFVSLAMPLAAQELIVNGDFELGNSGFTSAYTYSHGNINGERTYDILADPHTAHGSAYSYGDHTSGHGLMMAINGATVQGTTVWSKTVPVTRNTRHVFGLWISSWTPTQPAVLNISINGVSYSSIKAPSTAGIWQYFTITFNSGNTDSAVITLLDSNTASAGNDFALDDISMRPCGDQWILDGVAICTATGFQQYPQITADGAGGAIVTWWDYRSGNHDIYAQRVNASGVVQWTTDGVALCTAMENQESPQITADGAGGAIVTWWDYRSGNYDIYAQRVNASGVVQWTTDGVALCTATDNQESPQITSDGAGGAIVTWWDYRSGNYDIYAQRVNALGVVQWTTDGVALCTATGHQYDPEITSDGAGGAIVTWNDSRSGSNLDIYTQRVNASGAVQWTTDGVALCTATGDQLFPKITSDGWGGAIVTWEDYRSGSNYDIYAQRVNASGAVQWTANGVALCTVAGEQYHPAISSDGAGGAIVTWQDYRSGNWDIYAQRVNASGAIEWTANGVALCTATGDQQYSQIIFDGTEGAIITWQDYRNGSSLDIYTQRVNGLGSTQWMANGAALCTATGDQGSPAITFDGVGGAIVTWYDYRIWGGNYDIYAERIDAAGHTVCATLLQNYAATFIETGIEINWALSEIDADVDFFVQRSGAPNGSFLELPLSALSRDGLSFSFVDRNWEPGTSYWYRVEYNRLGERKTLFETGPIVTPVAPLILYQNSPNPFNPSTTIRYYLPDKCKVNLEVYDISGRRVVGLLAREQEKGAHTIGWDGRNENGHSVATGIYFCRLTAGKAKTSKKMVLLR